MRKRLRIAVSFLLWGGLIFFSLCERASGYALEPARVVRHNGLARKRLRRTVSCFLQHHQQTSAEGVKNSSDGQARQVLEFLCTRHRFPFLVCRREPDGKLQSFEGYFGMGVVVDLLNTGKAPGYALYRNCPANQQMSASNSSPLRPPRDFVPACRVPPEETALVPAFLKTVKHTAQQENTFSYLPQVSPLWKEEARTRDFAFLTYPSSNFTVALGAAVYDVAELATGKTSALQEYAYMQELLNGHPAYALIDVLQQIELQSFVDNIDRVLGRVRQVFSAQSSRAQSGSTASQGVSARQRALNYLEATVRRAQKEVWLRTRLRFRLAHTVFAAAAQMWSLGIVHCDLHWQNIMILKTAIRTPQEFLDGIIKGSVIIPELRLFYSETQSVPPSVLRRLQRRGFIEAYQIHPHYVRFIDIAYTMQVETLLTAAATKSAEDLVRADGEKTGSTESSSVTFPLPDVDTTGPAPPERALLHPCRAFRGGREEDLIELYRLAVPLLFPSLAGTGATSNKEGESTLHTRDLWDRALKGVMGTEKWPSSRVAPPASTETAAIPHDVCIQEVVRLFLTSLQPTQGAGQNAPAPPLFASSCSVADPLAVEMGIAALRAVRDEADRATRLLNEVNRQFMLEPHFLQCQKARQEWQETSREVSQAIARSSSPQDVLKKYVSNPCAFSDIRQGGNAVLRILETLATHIPEGILLDLPRQ